MASVPILVLSLLLLLTPGARADEAVGSQAPSQAPLASDGSHYPTLPTDPATNAALDQLFAAQDIGGMMDRTLILLVDDLIRKNPGTAPGREQLLAYFRKYAGWRMVEPFYRAEYAQAFTLDELHALTIFAKTALGRKANSVVPEIMSKAMSFAQIVMEGHRAELRAIIVQAMSASATPRAPVQ